MPDGKWKSSLRRRLLNWFNQHQRDLPWRKNKTAYRVWISEIMLQQTQVATVIDYFQRFIKRFPNVRTLAAAQEQEVLKYWEGLGYYRRARQLHAAARQIVDQHGGKFPLAFDEVLALPGIGRYTAGAILSIASEQRYPILEGNTIRLLARLLAMETDPRVSENQKTLWSFSESLLPRKRVGDFNQSLMELGSKICTPKNPACDRCPLLTLCPTFLRGLQHTIPAAGKKTDYENITEAVVLVSRNGKYLVRRCGPGERWEGLWDFPRYRVENQRAIAELGPKLKQQFGLTTEIRPTDQQIKHAVTRFRITLDCFVAESVQGRLNTRSQPCAWKSPAEIEELAMSVTGRKIAKKLVNEGSSWKPKSR